MGAGRGSVDRHGDSGSTHGARNGASPPPRALHRVRGPHRCAHRVNCRDDGILQTGAHRCGRPADLLDRADVEHGPDDNDIHDDQAHRDHSNFDHLDHDQLDDHHISHDNIRHDPTDSNFDKRPPMTILDALDDPNLLGAAFPDAESWTAWRAFLAAVYGLPMTADQAAIFRRHTGRQTSPEAQAREVWCIAGRRAGKSRVAALLAVYVAAFKDYRPVLAPGEKATVAVIAADRQQARVVFRYICGLLDAVPMLRPLVVRQTANAVELRGNVVIEVHTCSFKSTRGYSFAAVIADEVAFWQDESSATPDVEVPNAVRPGLATIPGSLLVAISSPYSRRGALWQAFKAHYGQDGSVLGLAGSDPRHERDRAGARHRRCPRRRPRRCRRRVPRPVPI